ncbi:DUF2505 domain-containing protein [Mycolicibacter minnesotensis]
MPRSFEVNFESSASVEQVYSAFGERAYWLDRIKAFGGNSVLETLDVDDDGRIRVVVAEDLRHGALPGILSKVYRGDLNIVTTEVWESVGDGQVNGTIDVAVTGAPGSGAGSAVLQRSGAGSKMELNGTVRFKVPLVGGTIETYLAREFETGIPDIYRFTTTWLGENA